MTYEEWLKYWLELKHPKVKMSTYATYRYAIFNHIIPSLGIFNVHQITAEQIQNLIYTWQNEDYGLSGKTIKDIVTIIKASIKDYCKAYHYSSPILDLTLPNHKTKSISIFNREEQTKIIHQVFFTLTPRNVGIALGLCLGLRIGEVCGLRWKDVNFQERYITISNTAQRVDTFDGRNSYVVISSPKTHSSFRIVPMGDTILRLMRLIYKNANQNAFVITGTEKCTEPRTFLSYFYRFLKNIDVPTKRFHALRHTFATNMIEIGTDIKTLSIILGHSSVTTTMEIYVHPQLNHKRQAIEKLEHLVLNL